ncbi:hypothetical protein [Streptococcus oricebi]|uniref:Uncharacterized protein n=1 Tax=Streptococcus oricebi TaxID=1547447 RepID=A0ABS5B3C1_9STRE|nr:hypothetical protein [Streptococcus oricebi]MBP2623166.1 hypothetical protein [Streptococcus oricebi]
MVSRNMICPNKKCRYEFFEREKGYVACPSCGQEIKENMPTNPARRSEAIVKMLAFRKFLKLEKTLIIITITLFCIVFIIAILTYAPRYSYGFRDYFLNRAARSSVYIIPSFLMLIFSQSTNNYKFIRKTIGEDAWYLSTFKCKLFKWFVYGLTIFALFKTFIPYFYNYYLGEFLKHGLSSANMEQKVVYFYILMIYVSLAMIELDLIDLYQRHLSRKLDRRYFK